MKNAPGISKKINTGDTNGRVTDPARFPYTMIKPTIAGQQGSGLYHFDLICGECGAADVIPRTTRKNVPYADLMRAGKRKGWKMDPSRRELDLCPVCAAKVVPLLDGVKYTVDPPPVVAAETYRKLNKVITKHFDAEAGAYADGYSDAQVAAETETDVAIVANFRNVYHGELKPPALPPELGNLRSELQAARELLDSLSARCDELVAKSKGQSAP